MAFFPPLAWNNHIYTHMQNSPKSKNWKSVYFSRYLYPTMYKILKRTDTVLKKKTTCPQNFTVNKQHLRFHKKSLQTHLYECLSGDE